MPIGEQGFPSLRYELNDQTERHYQVVFYLAFSLMGQSTGAEVSSARGRADAVVWTRERIFVFEFKLAGTAEEALAQIDAQGCCVPYEADGRQRYLGVRPAMRQRRNAPRDKCHGGRSGSGSPSANRSLERLVVVGEGRHSLRPCSLRGFVGSNEGAFVRSHVLPDGHRHDVVDRLGATVREVVDLDHILT